MDSKLLRREKEHLYITLSRTKDIGLRGVISSQCLILEALAVLLDRGVKPGSVEPVCG